MSSFSIIIPVHNQITFLRDAIQSVLVQRAESIEVLVVDDGSDTAAANGIKLICEAAFEGVTLFRLGENKGVSAARNFGVSHATNDFVIFLDADDLLADGYLSQCSDAIAGGSMDVLVSKTSLMPACEISDAFRKAQRNYDLLTHQFHHSDIQSGAYFTAYCPAIHALVFKRGVFSQYRFNEQLTYGEDRYLLLQLRQGQLRFEVTQILSGYYRVGGQSGHATRSKLKYLHTVLESEYLSDSLGRSYVYLLYGYYSFKTGRVGQALWAFTQGLRSPTAIFHFAKFIFQRLF